MSDATNVSQDTDTPPSYQQFGRICKLLVGVDASKTATGTITSNADGTMTMSNLQSAEVAAAGLDLSQLRITFTVTRHSISAPHHAIIRVYNLSRSTTERIQKEFNRVFLQVGYKGGPLSTIFNGTVIKSTRGANLGSVGKGDLPYMFVDRREDQTNTYLEFIATDGDEGYNKAIVSVSMAAGATAEQQLKQISNALAPYSVGMGYYDLSGAPDQPLPRGLVLHGMAKDVLDSFCKWAKATWSITDGKLEIIRKDSYIPGNAIIISPDTGLIQTPRQTLDGVEFTTLLNPFLRIGRSVQIKSQVQQAQAPVPNANNADFLANPDPINNPLNAAGYYRLFYYQHVGDTRGNTWYTNAIGRDLQNDVPNPTASMQYGGAIGQ